MEIYGFEFRMKEMVLSPFAKMTNVIAKGFDSADAHNKSFQKGINDTGRLVNSLAAKMRSLEVKRTITLDNKQLKKIETQLDRLKKRHQELSKGQSFNTPDAKPTGSSMGGMMGMMTNPYVMAGLAGAYVVKQVIGAAGEMSNKGYEYERNKFGITQYTGNARTSETYIDKLSKTSAGKMFGSDAVSGFQQAMMGFKNAEKSFEFVTKTLSNISAGTGNKIAELAGIQMKTRMQGYVQMDEAQQWSERKIPLLEYLGKATNMNSEKLLKAIEQRKVKTESFDKALLMMTSGKGIFAGMTDKAALTGFGQKSSFDNTLDLKIQQAGNKFNELYVNGFYQAGNKFLEALDKNTPKISTAFSQLQTKLEMANTPLKGFGTQLDLATRSANGFTSLLTGLATIGGYFADKQNENIEKQARMGLAEKQIVERLGLYGRQLKDNFSGLFETPKLKKGESGFDHTFSRAEILRNKHTKEVQTMEGRHNAQNAGLERAVQEKKNLFEFKRQASHMRKKTDIEGDSKNTGGNPSTDTVGKGLGSAASTGGGVKNITLNISSLINQVQMIKENGKGLDTDQVRRILHEELTATIASAVMMGSGQ
jgi:hypothetical protein